MEDGRYFLQTQDQLYDVITGEPPPLKVAGVINLYTREYFQLIYDHLAAGGIHTYWLPVDNLSDEDMGAVIGAYCDVFEDCSLWNGWRLQWMLAGSRRGGARATEESFGRQWRDPRVVDELTALGIEIPEQLGALFMADASVLREFAGRVEPLTDNFPKRLSNTIFAPDAALQRHARWMRTGPAREHFLTSDAILRTWPAALLERTLPYFDFQRIVNEVSVRPGARGTPERFFGDLHTILTGSPLRTLVLWHLGVSADVPSLVDRRIEAGDAPDAYARQLAIRALANRDYDAAATWFAAAVVKQPSDRFLEQCHLYSLLMAGRPDQARAAAETAFESRSPDGGDRSFWGWVQQTLDLDPPETIAM